MGMGHRTLSPARPGFLRSNLEAAEVWRIVRMTATAITATAGLLLDMVMVLPLRTRFGESTSAEFAAAANDA